MHPTADTLLVIFNQWHGAAGDAGRYVLRLRDTLRLKSVRRVEAAALLAGGAASSLAFIYDYDGWGASLLYLLGDALWVLELWLPYALFFVASRQLQRARPRPPYALLSCGAALLILAYTLRTYSTLWWWGRVYPGHPFIFAGPQLVMIIGGLGLLLIGAAILETIHLLAGRRT